MLMSPRTKGPFLEAPEMAHCCFYRGRKKQNKFLAMAEVGRREECQVASSPRKRASRTTLESVGPQKQTPEAEVPLARRKSGAKATVKKRVRVQVLSAETVHHWLECHTRNWKENLGG